MTSRVSETSKISFTPSRLIERMTLLPFGPRIFFTASTRVMSLVNWPSILMIMSPALTPALYAGVSSIGDTTVRTLLRIVISMPRPPKLPLVSTCSSLYSSGVRYALCGSSEVSMPLIAPSMS